MSGVAKVEREPLVSVVVPFFNRLHLLAETVQSVQHQTYSNWELILVNDGSTEDMTDVRKIIESDSRIRLIEQENKGVSAARNAGITAAAGEYIAFLDSDDLWREEKLEKQLSEMLRFGCCVSHTSYQLMDERGISGKIMHSAQQRGQLYPVLMSSCAIATPTVMIRADILQKMEEPFSEQFHIGEDICLWIDLSYQFEFHGLDMPLTKVRIGATTAAYSPEKQAIGLTNILDYINSSPIYRYEAAQINALWNLIEKNRPHTPPLPLLREPKVSIVIPVYNGGNYMRDAIDSALAQTYPNIEIIVINDGSCDDGETDRIAKSYGDKIRYFAKENGGVATALNLGIKKMEGDYFSWLSHDDMYTPQKIEREVFELSKSKNETTIVAGGYRLVRADCTPMSSVNLCRIYSRTSLKNPLFTLLHGGINGCALLIHKSHFQRVGLFDPQLPSTQDYDLWFRMFRGQKFRYYDGENVLSRWHEEQGSKKMERHLQDCNQLWINMLQKTTDAERCEMSGSTHRFFLDVTSFLESSTPYTDATAYAKQQAEQTTDGKQVLKSEPRYASEIIAAFDEGCKAGQSKWELMASVCGQIEISSNIEDLDNVLYGTNVALPTLVVYSTEWLQGGTERVLSVLLGRLCSKYRIILITMDTEKETGFPVPAAVFHLRIRYSGTIPLPQRLAAMVKLCDADIFWGNANLAMGFYPVYAILKQWSIRTLMMNHYYYLMPFQNPAFYHVVSEREQALSAADVVLWLTDNSAALCSGSHRNVGVMPNPNSFPLSGTRTFSGSKTVLAVGRFNDFNKRVDTILRVFREIYRRDTEAHLVMVGPYNLKEPLPKPVGDTIAHILKELELPKSAVCFEGEQSDVRPYYEQADLLLLASDAEGFCMVLTEAGTYGVPCIVAGTPGMEGMIHHGENGYIVDRDAYDEAADLAVSLMNNAELWESMSKKSQELSQRFEVNRIIERWETLLSLLLTDEGCTDKVLKENGFAPEEKTLQMLKSVDSTYQRFLLSICPERCEDIAEASLQTLEQEPAHLYDLNAIIYIEEIQKMQQSLSWRVTKPLRLIKKVFVTWRRDGFGAMLKKAWHKLSGH